MLSIKRTLRLLSVVSVLAAAIIPAPALAIYNDPLVSVASSGKRTKTYSLTAYKRCGGKTYRGQRNCTGISIVADPPTNGITELALDILYDPSRWIFKPLESGFLCDFTSTGGCPPANAQLGTFEVGALADASSFVPGWALAGSTASLTDDNVGGVVSLQYRLAAPLVATGEQNFFSFFFESVEPFSDISLLSYFDDEQGSYDFSQAGARCITVTGNCASLTPIVGINIAYVSAPPSAALLALGLLLLAADRRRRVVTAIK